MWPCFWLKPVLTEGLGETTQHLQGLAPDQKVKLQRAPYSLTEQYGQGLQGLPWKEQVYHSVTRPCVSPVELSLFLSDCPGALRISRMFLKLLLSAAASGIFLAQTCIGGRSVSEGVKWCYLQIPAQCQEEAADESVVLARDFPRRPQSRLLDAEISIKRESGESERDCIGHSKHTQDSELRAQKRQESWLG